jgi:hypothetical protein
VGIICTVTTPQGITVEQAYHRVDAMYGSKHGYDFSLNSYVSKAAYDGTEPFCRDETDDEFVARHAPHDGETDEAYHQRSAIEPMDKLRLPDPRGYFEQQMLFFMPDVQDNAPSYHTQAYATVKAMERYGAAIDDL